MTMGSTMGGTDDELAALVFALKSKRGGPGVRAQAARLLGESGNPRAIEPLLGQIQDTADPYKMPVVTAVLESLPRFGIALVEPLLGVLDIPGDIRRKYAPRLLVSAISADAAPTLVGLLDDSEEDVVLNAATALGDLRDADYAEPLRAMVDDEARPVGVRGVAASALGMTGAAGAYQALVALLGSDEHSLRAGAIDGLAELGDPRALPLLQALLSSNRLDERTARGAKLALISLRNRR